MVTKVFPRFLCSDDCLARLGPSHYPHVVMTFTESPDGMELHITVEDELHGAVHQDVMIENDLKPKVASTLIA
jgi:hypothetical protein